MKRSEEKPAWKYLEDRNKQKNQMELEQKTIQSLKDYFKENVIVHQFFEEGNTIFKLPATQLLSKKELIKLLRITYKILGIQIYENQLQIYKLHTKLDK